MTAVAWAIMFMGIVISDAANMYIVHSTKYNGDGLAASLALICLLMCIICTIRDLMD